MTSITCPLFHTLARFAQDDFDSADSSNGERIQNSWSQTGELMGAKNIREFKRSHTTGLQIQCIHHVRSCTCEEISWFGYYWSLWVTTSYHDSLIQKSIAKVHCNLTFWRIPRHRYKILSEIVHFNIGRRWNCRSLSDHWALGAGRTGQVITKSNDADPIFDTGVQIGYLCYGSQGGDCEFLALKISICVFNHDVESDSTCKTSYF